MQMEVKRLDSDLDNRWSTSGVVINRISPNGPADKAQLSTGELISYIIGEYTIQNAQEYAHAVKKAMKHDSNMLLYIKGKEPLRIATRKLGDKVGLQVEGNGTVRIKQITPGTPAANSDDIQIGDVIEK